MEQLKKDFKTMSYKDWLYHIETKLNIKYRSKKMTMHKIRELYKELGL